MGNHIVTLIQIQYKRSNMISNILIVIGALISGVMLGMFIFNKFKETFDSKQPDYYALYKEAAKRLKELMTETNTKTNSNSAVVSSLMGQLTWHRMLVERIIIKRQVSQPEFYNIIKEINDELGLKTPTMEELKEETDKLLKEMGLDPDQIREDREQYPLDTEFNLDDAEEPNQLSSEELLNSILEKITLLGRDSLTKTETEFLNEQSKR